MPTNQPSNAPDGIGEDARDDATAAAVLTDEQLDDAPGGGGLGGAAAAGRLGNTGGTPSGPVGIESLKFPVSENGGS